MGKIKYSLIRNHIALKRITFVKYRIYMIENIEERRGKEIENFKSLILVLKSKLNYIIRQ